MQGSSADPQQTCNSPCCFVGPADARYQRLTEWIWAVIGVDSLAALGFTSQCVVGHSSSGAVTAIAILKPTRAHQSPPADRESDVQAVGIVSLDLIGINAVTANSLQQAVKEILSSEWSVCFKPTRHHASVLLCPGVRVVSKDTICPPSKGSDTITFTPPGCQSVCTCVLHPHTHGPANAQKYDWDGVRWR